MTEQDREAMEYLVAWERCPYCDGVGGRTGPGGFMNCNHCDGTGRWWSAETGVIWETACIYKDQQHAEEMAEAVGLIRHLLRDAPFPANFSCTKRDAEAYLSKMEERG